MRSIKVDQFEFDDPGSEESLEIQVSRRSQFPHPDVKSFVGSVVNVHVAASLPEPVPFFKVGGRNQISEHLRRFANLDAPLHCDWPSYRLASESSDEVSLIICAPNAFIRYCWSTSA
jgi:hypothetical protein